MSLHGLTNLPASQLPLYRLVWFHRQVSCLTFYLTSSGLKSEKKWQFSVCCHAGTVGSWLPLSISLLATLLYATAWSLERVTYLDGWLIWDVPALLERSTANPFPGLFYHSMNSLAAYAILKLCFTDIPAPDFEIVKSVQHTLPTLTVLLWQWLLCWGRCQSLALEDNINSAKENVGAWTENAIYCQPRDFASLRVRVPRVGSKCINIQWDLKDSPIHISQAEQTDASGWCTLVPPWVALGWVAHAALCLPSSSCDRLLGCWIAFVSECMLTQILHVSKISLQAQDQTHICDYKNSTGSINQIFFCMAFVGKQLMMEKWWSVSF